MGETTAFPSVDLVPKKETKVLEFLRDHPEYDGRNVVIGILDTGIDPGATGLQFLPDGVTPKLIDLVDCTGSGDVDVSTIKSLKLPNGPEDDSNDEFQYYEVEALSGSTIRLSRSWWKSESTEKNKRENTPKVQLGLKLAYELFPAAVKSRVQTYRQERFDKGRSKYIADVREKLAAWQKQRMGSSSKPTLEELKIRDDLLARMDVLTDKEWDYDNDPGMILDCVVFFDGKDYRAVIGSVADEGTDWSSKAPLASFAKERRYATISAIDQYNYGVNFYDNGRVLSIVGDCTPHGTHVAAIAAASHEERSGVAPGAQLISIKIGDSRMGSMESGSSIARGIMTAIRLGCDIINLSYGEGSQLPNSGRVIKMAEELVWRHNILFVSAVGNNGPALSTVNSPGGMSSSILGIAAYVSPDMMKVNYSLESNTDHTDILEGTTYTWSSVGPASDGANGVTLCAPGGAIASVSNWTMQKSMLMNGTSMASPHACGCMALLLSACKAEGIPISQARIQRALENSAEMMPNLSSLQQGWGMLQVDRAFKHLASTKSFKDEEVYYEVYLEGKTGNPRGIYLREALQTQKKQVFTVRVNPCFQRSDDVDPELQQAKIDFELKCSVHSTASWVSAPEHFMLMNNGRAFKISVDPTCLPPGVHTAKVCGSDASYPERGIVWAIPITVVKPMEEQQRIDLGGIDLVSGETKRFFVSSLPGSTWMDITITDERDTTESSIPKLYVLHAVQLLPHAAYRDFAQQKYLNLMPSQSSVTSISVQPGMTCEVDVARYWSTSEGTKVKVIIEFRGVMPIPAVLNINSGDGFGLVRLQNSVKDEMINAAAKLVKWKTPVRPRLEGVISPLGERDIQPWSGTKTYQLLLTYEFSLDEKSSFTPRAPMLQGVLYESVFESQLILAYDGDKKYLGYCDAYAQSISGPKGSIVLKMQVRHDDPSMLEKLKDMTIWIERKLEKEITLCAYPTRENLLVGGPKRSCKKRTLRKGNATSIFFTEPPSSKIPPGCKVGDVLEGWCTYASGEASLPGDGKRPGGFPLSYVIGPKMDKPPAENDIPESKDERTTNERLEDAIRDLKVSHLEKLSKEEKERGLFSKIFSGLVKEYPKHLPLLLSNLKHLDEKKDRLQILAQIVAAADVCIQEISEDELALHFGKKVDKEDTDKVKRNKEMEKKKNILVESLVRKALALADSQEEKAQSMFDETLQLLKPWVDIDSNGKYLPLVLERECRAGRFGIALKRINKTLLKNGKDSGGVRPMTKANLYERRASVLKEIGYTSLHERDRAMKFVAAPSAYKLF